MKIFLKLATLLALGTGVLTAQSVKVFPAEEFLPIGGVQTVTAVVDGVTDTTVTWSSDGGTIYGSNPCTLHEPCAAGLTTSTVGTLHLTATSNANHALTATAIIHFTTSPTPRSDYPRMVLTTANLAAFQAKATAGNSFYQQARTREIGLITSGGPLYSAYASGTNLTCNGGNGFPSGSFDKFYWGGYVGELALMGEAFPADSYQWGCWSRDIFTYVAGQIATYGPRAGWAGNPWADISTNGGWPFAFDWTRGLNAFSNGSGATASATVTAGALNTPTLTAGGTGYTANATAYWFALQGSSGCSVISGNDIVAAGTVNVNSSGVVTGPMTIVRNASGCTSAPAIVIDSDLSLARRMMYVWLQWMVLNNYGNNSNLCSDATTNCYNSSAQFQTGSVFDYTGMRAYGNNYTQAKMLYLVAFSLAFNDDTTNDPPLTNTCSATRYVVCPDGTAGSLHAYWRLFAGGSAYLSFAASEEEHIAWQAYNAKYGNLAAEPTCDTTWGSFLPCFGLNRGAEAVEGRLYGNSASKARFAWIAAYTAGYLDPLLYGPQMSEASSGYWDLRTVADLYTNSAVIPSGATNAQVGAWTYWTTGDSNRYQLYPEDFETETANTIWDNLVGRTDMTSTNLWPIYNAAYGGPTGSSYACAFYCGWNTETANDLASGVNRMLMLSQPAWDPLANLPADPRPSLPLNYYAAANQHLMVRTGWGSTDSALSLYMSNTEIDHEHQFDGRFDLMSKGEYITKGRVEFNNYNNFMSRSEWQNMLGIHNSTGTNCADTNCFLVGTVVDGGPFWHSYQGGLVNLNYAVATDHISTTADTTNAYNGGSTGGFGGYNDVTSASTSQVFLRSTNQMVRYDRAVVGHSASTQSVAMNTTGVSTCSAGACSWTTKSGTQKAIFTSILPAAASVARTALPNSVLVTGPHKNLLVGTTMQLACALQNTDGSTTDCTSAVTWNSNNTAVATVSSTGLVTAVATGSVCIQGFSYTVGVAGGNSCDMSGPFGGTTSVVTDVSSGTFDSSLQDTNQVGDWEMGDQIKVTPSGAPTSSRFLSVLEWGSTALTPASKTLVQSTAGQNFDGTLIGTNAVLFMRDWPATFTGTTYPASGATSHYLANLTPNTTYAITATGAPSTASTDSAGVLQFASAGTGSVTVAPGGGANTWYVTTTGSDTNPCTSASPCATPDHVVNLVAAAGDTVSVAAGVYSYGTGEAHFTGGGTSGLPINVTCATRGTCKITNAITGNSPVVWLDHDYINFNGFEVTNTGAGNNLGVYITANFIRLTQNTIHDIQTDCTSTGGGGVQVATTAIHDITIDSNLVYNISWSGSTPKCNSGVVQTDGILAENTGTNDVITNNIVYSVSGGWGIGTTSNALISNNTVFNTVNGGIMLNNAASGAIVENNIVVYTGLPAHDGLYYGGTCAIQNGTASVTTYGHNDLSNNHGGNYGTGFGCSGTGLNTGDIAVDPATGTTFLNWQQNGSGDYHEAVGSPTIAAGISAGVTHDYANNVRPSGSGYDMGAYQFVSGSAAATPTFSPVAGTYTGSQTVTISTTTPAATLYYTTDGTTPTPSSTVYSTPIAVAVSETVKAIATASGLSQSAVGSAAYVINTPTVATPSASPLGGFYSSTQTVTLADSTAGATICYTLNGTTPTATTPGTCDGLTYTTALSIPSTTTLKAIGTKATYLNSAVDTEVYTITLPGTSSAVAGAGTISGTFTIQ